MKRIVMTIVAVAMVITASAQTSGYGYYKGDLNKDNKITMEDVALMVSVLKGETAKSSQCYVDSDGNVDLTDLQVIVDIVLGKKDKEWVNAIPIGTDPVTPEQAESKSSTIGGVTDR